MDRVDHSLDRIVLEHKLLYTLAENVPHRIYAKDAEGRFVFANSAVASGMGVSGPADLLGRTDFEFYPKEAASEYFAQEQALLRSGQPILNREEHVRYLLLKQEAWLLIISTKIPLRDEAGRAIGLVGINYDITPLKAAEQALRAANALAEEAAQALAATVEKLNLEMRERQRVEEELRQQAQHDVLTGLPNRSLLMTRIEQSITLARCDGRSMTLLFIDLDRFKLVNDSLGHAIGDQLIKVVTQRVNGCIRGSDTLARLGGDEFVVLLPNSVADDVLTRLLDRITQAVADPVVLGEREVSVTCSIGCSSFPKDGTDAVTLLRHADAAMYEAKEQGRNTVRRYTAGLSRCASDQLDTESHLRRALQREEFTLHYQPQVNLRTGAIVGVEALIRWRHPELGLVSPMSFIPIAEQTGLIRPIGQWVLRSACQQAAAWQRAGLAPIRMSVNLSAQQLHDPTLEAQVCDALLESDLPPHHLELEITESVSMKRPDETIRILDRFKALGIGLAIDDFGTGYSNLAYLMRFPVDRIKLDRSFVSELTVEQGSQAIVEAVVVMAHKLRLEIVAEGVETIDQCDRLAGYGCDLVQGYWFSRPLDASACESLMRQRLAGRHIGSITNGGDIHLDGLAA